MPHIIVEYVFDPPMTEEGFDAMGKALGPCLQSRNVTWKNSYIAQDRRRRVCIYEAVDAQSVREAYKQAGVGFERAWSADALAE